MGIKHFFKWFKRQFSEHIKSMQVVQTLDDFDVSIDNFMIDMNGLFHNSAQQVFKYGEFAPKQSFLGQTKTPLNDSKNREETYKKICERIDFLKSKTKPKKRLILCVDGPAPLSKQNQQRQRRFKSAMDKGNKAVPEVFDSNCMTPGTRFMHDLSVYIRNYIEYKMLVDETYKNLEIVFSCEKTPGEGEQKLVSYMRKYGSMNESFCIHGADADIIMLALATHFPKMYILRDDLMKSNNFFLDIGRISDDLYKCMYWEGANKKSTINDFILMCFMVGNDFLPHIPSIEIIQGSIELMISTYKQICSEHGHLTRYEDKNVFFVKETLSMFFEFISTFEKESFELKLSKSEEFFPNKLLESRSEFVDGKWNVDIKRYRRLYYRKKLKGFEIEHVCHEYLQGVQWILTYYTTGVIDWKWKYLHHYSPFSFDLAKYTKTFVFTPFEANTASTPFNQLLSVLPISSSHLIPEPLNSLLFDEKSLLHEYCPLEFEIDKSGVKYEWEAVVVLPMIDYKIVEAESSKIVHLVKDKDVVLNSVNKSHVYKNVKGNIVKTEFVI